MARLQFLAVGLAVLMLTVASARAEDPAGRKAAKAPIPPLADAAGAADALAAFKTAYKAKGRKGDAKLAARVFAIKTLSQTQHKKVVDKLFKLTQHRDPDLRTAAVQYLGRQRALPGYAGARIIKAMDKHLDDLVIQISGLQAIQDLAYRKVEGLLRSRIQHKDFAVKKSAFFAIGEMHDMRLLKDVFQLLKKLKASKGEKWDGVSVSHDTGASGTHDQEMAEKKGKEMMAKNKRKGRRGGRAQRDIGPIVEEVLERLTGEVFEKAQDAQDWMKANKKPIEAAKKNLNDQAATQVAAAKKVK